VNIKADNVLSFEPFQLCMR